MRSSWMTSLFIVSATLMTAWTQNSLAENSASRGQSQSANAVTVAAGNVSPLNFSVFNYAANRLGQKVGDGECATLASEALKSIGAKNFWELGPQGYDADYIWGSLITTITQNHKSTANIASGDIIQFRNVSTYKEMTYPDGSWRSYSSIYNHHTAIVKAVVGSQIYVLHQNVGDQGKGHDARKIVQNGVIDLKDLTSGTMWVYRPLGSK